MNTIRKSFIIGMAVLALGSTTLVVQAHEGGQAAKHGQQHGKWAERVAKREQKLHALLKLTPAQEGAWASYTAAIKPAARDGRGERGEPGNRAAWKAMAAPERMEKHIAMAKERIDKMETRLAATNAFYGVLTAEQKKLFDDNSMHRGGHRGGQHGKRGMHG